MKVSILIPCYNEKNTILEIVKRVLASPITQEKEIIIVDDCSQDGTRNILAKEIEPLVSKIIYHSQNQGKGGAINTGLKSVTGDILIIQDADLEYDPNEYPKLIAPIINDLADVVYGSRFLSRDHRRVLYYWPTLGNYLLTWLFNLVFDKNFTDVETCYKVFKKEIYQKINLKEKRFGFDPEITAKAIKLKANFFEVSIGYLGRSYEEGKKISWLDALTVMRCIFKYRFFD